MVNKILKYSAFSIFFIVLILAFTNPSLNQFKEHLGDRSWNWKYYQITTKRTQNWLIFSTFEMSYNTDDNYYNERNRERTEELNKLTGSYTGFFLNFFKQ